MSRLQNPSAEGGAAVEIKHKQTFQVLGRVPAGTLEAADLQGAELAGAGLVFRNLSRADLRGADLQSADLRYATLRGADLRGANLRGAVLDGADLRSAKLEGAKVAGASFVRCTGLHEARLEQMRAAGAWLDEEPVDRPVAGLGNPGSQAVASAAPAAPGWMAAFGRGRW